MPRDVLGGGADVQGIAVGPQGPSGNTELGSASITANPPAATTTAFVAISGLSTTVTVGSRPVEIKLHVGQIINNNATLGVLYLGLFRDGTEIAEIANFLPASQFAGSGAVIIARDAPAAGSHTYDIRQKIGATGQSGNVLASASGSGVGPARLSVNEV